MQVIERTVTIMLGSGDDRNVEERFNVLEKRSLRMRRFADAVEMPGEQYDFQVFKSVVAEVRSHALYPVLEVLEIFICCRFSLALEEVVLGGIEYSECPVREFLIPEPDAEEIGERAENIEGFAGYTLLFFLREVPDGLHVVQPVCKLDENDADIPPH